MQSFQLQLSVQQTRFTCQEPAQKLVAGCHTPGCRVGQQCSLGSGFLLQSLAVTIAAVVTM